MQDRIEMNGRDSLEDFLMTSPFIDSEGVSTLEAFRESWLESVREGAPSTVELGRRFALKLVTQWLDQAEVTADFVFCDGSGDGGIDVALLDTGSDDPSDPSGQTGHTWYLVQSKYGSAFAGDSTLLTEGQKVIDTLDGKRSRLNSLAAGVLERLTNFRNGSGPNDKIVLLFATELPLNDSEQRCLRDLRAMGRDRLKSLFDVETISIKTIYDRLKNHPDEVGSGIEIKIDGKFVHSGDDLLVGAVNLMEMFDFLNEYRNQTGDIDQIYEKNVRRFLGGRGKVNKGMTETLQTAPEKFGLYNNGITIVVNNFVDDSTGALLIQPYIVNGCQTSRTIWQAIYNKVSSGGTGTNPELVEWKEKVKNGVVVTKIVRVGASGDALLQAITRYTNSQNAVREKDFIALTSEFNAWKQEMSDRYDIYLEIQRGGWDSQKALQNTNPKIKHYTKHTNAADLMKIYAAGWLSEPGMAFGKNQPFLPGGHIFKRIVNNLDDPESEPFGSDDLYACYLLQVESVRMEFGKGAKDSRRLSRFVFYMLVVELLRDVLKTEGKEANLRALSAAVAKVLNNPASREALITNAIAVIDSYFTAGTQNSVFSEDILKQSYASNINAYMKAEDFGRDLTFTPNLEKSLALRKEIMSMELSGPISARSQILAALS